MRRSFQGKFKEIALLVVAATTDAAYGVTVWEKVQAQTSCSITLSADSV
jgi:hypothetical protein